MVGGYTENLEKPQIRQNWGVGTCSGQYGSTKIQLVHRCRKQSGSIEAMLCRAKSCCKYFTWFCNKFLKARTFKNSLQNQASVASFAEFFPCPWALPRDNTVISPQWKCPDPIFFQSHMSKTFGIQATLIVCYWTVQMIEGSKCLEIQALVWGQLVWFYSYIDRQWR